MEFPLLLPQLKSACDVGSGGTTGEWLIRPPKAFGDVASSLDYKSPGELKSISSVPTMWARPLIMEMAFHNPEHPIRAQAIAQWQGMLAAIALAEVRGFPLKVKLVELEKLRLEPFGRSLYDLAPDPSNALYRNNDKNPWYDIYVWLWNDQPVGITSPSTLVVPSEEGKWGGLPWWKENRLHAPQAELNQNEKELFWHWLNNLKQELSNHNGNGRATNAVVGLINKFQATLGGQPNQPLSLSADPHFFGEKINRGVLVALNCPIQAPPKPSSVRIIPSKGKQPKKDLLLIDPGIANYWHQQPQTLWIHKGKTLASLNLEDLREKRILWDDIRWIEPDDLFLRDLVFIDHSENALPGALMPEETQPLTLAGERITPLIPLNPILLDYLTPEELQQRIKFQPITGGQEPKVRVILDLPLSGESDGDPPALYRLYKEYVLKKENALSGVPVLEVWPNLKAPGWKEYYTFYYDSELGKDTFQVYFPESTKVSQFKDSAGGIYQYSHLEQFPSVIQCQDEAKKLRGLILLKQPSEIIPKESWTVGVDFGTSFTNVYVGRGGVAEPLPMESLHLMVTNSPTETRIPVLLEYFIPAIFLPADKPLPLSSVMTTQGSDRADPGQDGLPIFDGRIYVPNVKRFDPRVGWIQTDLKWTNFSYHPLFLKNLAVYISAIAASNQVNKIQWSLSYPSAFSRNNCSDYAKTWNDICNWLAPRTGMTYNCPDMSDSKHFRTESLAVAQYFADQERHDLVYTTCIDMGGGTSDISVWENNTLLHQCSVQLAGRDLLSQILELKPQFLERYFSNYSDNLNWRGLRGGAFNAKMDGLLRWHSENWLREKRRTLTNDSEFQSFLQIMAVGVAGLYYYVGNLLRVLNDEGKYSRPEITPVYVGGNGCRLLHWLDHTGTFNRNSEINELLSRMISLGTRDLENPGFKDIGVDTQLSQIPKEEVACGLVLDYTRLEGLDRKAKDPIIAGESFVLNGQSFPWNSRLEIEEEVTSFSIPAPLNRISQFMYDFHQALRDLDIEGIEPMKAYKRSLNPDDNEKLWRGTQRSLENLLQSIEFKGNARRIRIEPPFILGLKALLHYLSREWANNR